MILFSVRCARNSSTELKPVLILAISVWFSGFGAHLTLSAAKSEFSSTIKINKNNNGAMRGLKARSRYTPVPGNRFS